MSNVSDEVRGVLITALRARINPQTPSESLRDLAEACRHLGVFAGHDVADSILFEIQYRSEQGSAHGLRGLAEAWALLQPPGRIVDLVPDEPSRAHTVAPIS